MAVIDDFFGKKTVQQNKSKRKPSENITQSSPQKKQKSVNSTTSSSSSSLLLSADDILKTIPDADPSLLELSPDAEKLNYFQLKAKRESNPTLNNTTTTTTDINDIPEGRENCLNGLTIVFTGVLPNLDRDQCEQLAQRYGAKITKSISGKTSLVVIGNDAGPSKVKKIKSLKTKCIDESGFIQLITKMPADGGSGEAAIKELNKKKEIENEIKKEIEEEQRLEEQNAVKKQSSNNPSSSSSSLSAPAQPKVVDKNTQLWTDKYSPTDLKHICGNKSNVELLKNWLENWFNTKHDLKGSTINDFKAVLISGPPGIGKTTAATLISKLLGYEVIEKNASDFRSKKILNDNLKVCLDNTSIKGFFDHNNDNMNKKKFVLLMDEVDGMSSGDNGGVSQIAQFCRTTKTPMILICNDKSLPKMRTLDKCCFDLTWRRPSSREMKSRLMSIAHRENLKLDPNLIDQLVSITHNDIRQIINIMSTVSRNQNSLNHGNLNNMQNSWEKEVSLKPFDIVGKLLSNNRLSINEKISLYFNDMDIVPLMIHENYKMTQPVGGNGGGSSNSSLNHLKLLDEASDLISESDIVNSKIRSGEQLWSLLPFHAILSTVYPSFKIQGQITNRINFTSWLGQNSKKMKFDRIVQNLQYHTCIKTKSNNDDLRLDYIPFLKDKLINPIAENGNDGIETVLKFMDEYYLTKEDFDNVLELSVHGSRKIEDKYKKVPTSVKSAFTRKYNSYIHPTVIYKTGDSVGKGGSNRLSRGDSEGGLEGEDGDVDVERDGDNDESDDKDDDISRDSLIKSKTRPSGGKAGAKGSAKSNTKRTTGGSKAGNSRKSRI